MADRFIKDPDGKLNYQVDWSDWLVGTDTISASTWTVPDGITAESDTHDDETATVILSGGTVGSWYSVVNHIVTDFGLEDDRTIRIKIEER